jgi:hypothetical protein
MSGVLNVMAGAVAGKFVYTVTIGEDPNGGQPIYEYSALSERGSISPTTFRGSNIVYVGDRTNSHSDFGVSIEGTLSQDYFRSILVQSTAGTWRRFDQSDAETFVSGFGGRTIWEWSTSGGAVWTATGTRQIIIEF